MPIVSFGLLGVGILFVYSGYLGYSPAQVTKAILDGKLSTLTKIPIDPRKRGKGQAPQVSPTTPTPGTQA